MASANDLQGKTVAQLRSMARQAKIRGFSRMKRAELIAALSSEQVPTRKSGATQTKAARSARNKAAIARKKEAVSLARTKTVESEPAVVAAPTPYTNARRDEDLGPLPGSYQEDYLAVVPRDPEWTFIHWEMTDKTWKAATGHTGAGHATLRVVFEGAEGSKVTSDALVNPRQGRFYARVPSPGALVSAEVGVLDGRGAFHPVLRSAWVRTPWVGPRKGPARFMTVPPGVPLRASQHGGDVESVGRLLTEDEYQRLFGRGVPGSIPR